MRRGGGVKKSQNQGLRCGEFNGADDFVGNLSPHKKGKTGHEKEELSRGFILSTIKAISIH